MAALTVEHMQHPEAAHDDPRDRQIDQRTNPDERRSLVRFLSRLRGGATTLRGMVTGDDALVARGSRRSLAGYDGPHDSPDVDAVPLDAAEDAGELDAAPATFGVSIVCTGNICRSAYVQYALQAQLNALLGDRGRAEVTSAGTEPNQALTVPGPLLDLAPSRRVRAALTQHRPQQLTGRSLAGQDLVLTATDDHLDEVLREDPAAVRRTFTILGMGTLLRDHGEELAAAVPPGAGVTALVTALAELRSRLIAHGERPDADLPDPFRGPAEGYAAMAQTAQPIVELLAWEIARALDGDLVEEEPTGA